MRKGIIFISPNDLKVSSAVNNRLLAIARGLAEQGVEVTWISLVTEVSEAISQAERYHDIRFIQIVKVGSGKSGCKPVNYLLRLVSLLLLSGRLKSLNNTGKLNACFTLGDDFVFLAILRRLMLSKGIKVFHERTEYPYLGRLSLLRRINLKLYHSYFIPRVDHLFTITTSLHGYFCKYLETRGKTMPVSILNMLVEPDKYESDSCSKPVMKHTDTKTRDITYVGTMYGDKDGVYNLIEAFLMIKPDYPDIRLVLVGDCKKTERMGRILKLANPSDRCSDVVFIGQLDHAGVNRYLQNAYCLALARPNNIQARYGFPTKLGEYLASAKPVVVTKTGDIPLFLIDGVNAYLSEPDNVNSFAAKLRECLDDPDRARDIGVEGRTLVDTVFNYRECVKTVLAALQ
ncbi:MAG TPA: glycosyltransferase [Candidatus Cloacimonadota bacterium]|nr:glycosyltransferase [Candidatus Cloacimonadota bacterium]